MLNKFLIISFSVLAIVVIVEVAFLFYTLSSDKSKKETVNTISQPITPTPTPIGGPLFQSYSLRYLVNFGKILKTASISGELQGEVVEIFDKPGQRHETAYEKGLILKTIDEPKGKDLLFRKTDLSALKLYKQGQLVDFSTLKVGDLINVEIVIDLMRDPLYNRETLNITIND